ncbi:MAG: DUF2065 domain-containing protein [Methylophilales bacterium]|nr:DUF2065 domain-containing protein [Methylophilales bacterium]
MIEGFVTLIGIVLLAEGVFPLFFPALWKTALTKLLLKTSSKSWQYNFLSKILGYKNGQIRFIGFFFVLLGIIILLMKN